MLPLRQFVLTLLGAKMETLLKILCMVWPWPGVIGVIVHGIDIGGTRGFMLSGCAISVGFLITLMVSFIILMIKEERKYLNR